MRFLRVLIIGGLLLGPAGSWQGVFAQESAEEQPDDGVIRLHLMDDSVVVGALSVDSIQVSTEFGVLDVPVTKILSITPGLDSHPAEKTRIARLIQQLGANLAEQRDAAQKELLQLGSKIRALLEPYREDEDNERRARVQKILAELDELADEQDLFESSEGQPLIPEDTVETTLFTVKGEISPKSFAVKTKYGQLSVALSDIRRGEREMDEQPEIRKSINVSGQNIVQFNIKNTGIRINRGDKLSFSADGTIVMSPWGNNVTSTPEGGANFQWYEANKIPGGALVGRIGSSGKVFKIGSNHEMTATRPGVLYLGIAMAHQFANQNYQFPGQYNVKVRVNPN